MKTTSMLEVRIDRSKSLVEEPSTGHNRWHPDIDPVIRCEPGDEVILETRDAFDGQLGPGVSLEDVAGVNLDRLHPLTGPVFVEGAEPGDLLDIEIVDIEPADYGYTAQVPGFGFLRDEFPDPFKVDWTLAGGWATSADLPGLRIPGGPFMGTIGLSPGHELLAATTAREQALLDRGGFVLPPSAASAVPSDPHIAAHTLRTIPPANRAATSTSSNSPKALICSSPSTPPEACSPPATPTSPRETARRAALRSRWTPRSTSGSTSAKARPSRRGFVIHDSPETTTTYLPSSRHRDAATPRPASR